MARVEKKLEKKAEKTCEEKEKKHEVAQERVASKVARGELAVAPPTRELEKSEKTCAEKEKKYKVAQERLDEYRANPNPSERTHASVMMKTQDRYYLTARSPG